MKTRVLVEFEIECERAEDAVTVVDGLLDNGVFQDPINQHDLDDAGALKVTSAVISTLEDDLQEIMWPADNPDKPWSPDTIDEVRDRVRYLARPSLVCSKCEKENIGATIEDECESCGGALKAP